MTFFISGGTKSGKSSLAQDLAVALANGGKHSFQKLLVYYSTSFSPCQYY